MRGVRHSGYPAIFSTLSDGKGVHIKLSFPSEFEKEGTLSFRFAERGCKFCPFALIGMKIDLCKERAFPLFVINKERAASRAAHLNTKAAFRSVEQEILEPDDCSVSDMRNILIGAAFSVFSVLRDISAAEGNAHPQHLFTHQIAGDIGGIFPPCRQRAAVEAAGSALNLDDRTVIGNLNFLCNALTGEHRVVGHAVIEDVVLPVYFGDPAVVVADGIGSRKKPMPVDADIRGGVDTPAITEPTIRAVARAIDEPRHV